MPAEGEEMRSPRLSALTDLPQRAADVIERLRARAPRVHCITNTVAQNFTANALLAAGCAPSMTLSAEEIGAFVAGADALLVNLGTLDAERRQATDIAVTSAGERGVPWVLDPVFVDRSAARAEFARSLLVRKPTIVRLNQAEFAAFAGAPADHASAAEFSRAQKCVVAVSGSADLVSDGERVVQILNGHPFMSQVTAMGCAGSALLAACLAVADDAFTASVAGLLLLGTAGELAAAHAKGPGTFAANILDALHALDTATLLARARIA
jgi:hydroxyethylthiazole kinase